MIKNTIPASVILCMTVLFTPLMVMAHPAQELIRDTTDGVIERIVSDRQELEANPEKLHALVSELILPHMDFFTMSRWVLGEYWKQASMEQRIRFVEEFRALLIRTYSSALLQYAGHAVEVLAVQETSRSDLVVVKTVLSLSAEQSLPVNYRMFLRDGVWKVVDILIDNISLSSTYRGSFASEIKRNGIDSIIDKLHEKNAS